MLITTIFAFVFVLGVVIVIHEGGHFLVAKAVGVYVRTFSIGFGPKLLRKRVGETEYALSALPLGGYVKMAGEGVMEEIQDAGTGAEAAPYAVDVDEEGRPIPEDRLFSTKTPLQRLAVVVAGPLMNLVLALVIMTGLLAVTGIPMAPVTTIGTVEEGGAAEAAGLQVGDRILSVAGEPVEYWEETLQAMVDVASDSEGQVPLRIEREGTQLDVAFQVPSDEGPADLGMWYRRDTRVGKVRKGGPAFEAGLQRGDVILAVDGQTVGSFPEIADIINDSIDKPLTLKWEREGEVFERVVVPEEAELPVSLKEVRKIGRIFYEEYKVNTDVPLGQAVVIGSRATWQMVEQIASFLKAFVTGGASRDAVSGPIRIGKVAGEMASWGFDRLLFFLAFFSVNLFLLNLLPIPVLDGGHAVFILYEMISRRRANQKVQLVATQVGFVLLLLLMAFVITMDVINVAS